MDEIPFFIKSGNLSLFAVLHKPAADQASDTGIVMCSPFAEEKLWAHRVYVNFAKLLCSEGYHVMRFDYAGTGDSDGDFENTTLRSRLDDIGAVLSHMSTELNIQNIALMGMGLGASLASIASEAQKVNHLILWQPVFKGAPYIQGLLRSNLTTQMAIFKEVRQTTKDLIEEMRSGKTVNMDGYEIRFELFDQLSKLDILDRQKNFKGRTLAVQIGRKQEEFGKNFLALKELYQDCSLAYAVEEPFWKEIKPYCPRAENLYQETLKWLRGNL